MCPEGVAYEVASKIIHNILIQIRQALDQDSKNFMRKIQKLKNL